MGMIRETLDAINDASDDREYMVAGIAILLLLPVIIMLTIAGAPLYALGWAWSRLCR